MRRSGLASLFLLLLLCATSPSLAAAVPEAGPAPGRAAERGRYQTYLPGLWAGDNFGFLPAAWADGSYGSQAVTLFRYSFTLDQPIPAAQLELFADTRYEAWLDGAFRGRGPARFSRTTHEYDVLPLDDLGAGRHLLAILVQWAPNARRSESTTPHLRARILGGPTPIAPAPGEWRTLQTSAWNPDAALVHSLDLLGPSELLDLRSLPAAWTSPGFDDTSWRSAVAVQPPLAFFQPRSISRLSEVQMPLMVRASGPLLPSYWLGELDPGRDGTASYRFTLSAPTLASIQALRSPGLPDPAGSVTLDGDTLDWRPVDGEPPDLLLALRTLPAGSHQLSVSGLNVAGGSWPFAISSRNISSARPSFDQGVHAGRRLLLAGLMPRVSSRTRTARASASMSFTETPSYAILDLGRTVHGRLVAEVSGPAGSVVDIGWDERLWKDSRPLPYPGSLHPEWNQTDSWVLDGNSRSLTTIDARAGRYILIAVWGPGPVRLDNLRVLEERYPLTLRGSFSSDRPLLNRIWQIGVDTLYPSMNDAYADPWRERGQWWGDANVADHANSVAFGDTQLLRRGLLLMAEAVSQNNGRARALAPSGQGASMVDYGMLWVQSTRDYLNRTGDSAFVGQIYPATRAFLSFLERQTSPSTGLIDLPDRFWNETAYIDSSSYFDRTGQTTAVNAMYYGTLLDAAALALAVGDSEGAKDYSARAITVRERANRYLYRPDQGLYVAAIVEGRETPPSPQAQALALAYGLPASTETQRVADALLASLGSPEAPTVQIYGMFWVLEGLGRADRGSDAVDVIERYFGRMVQRGATTWWENFAAIDRYTSSLSHAWGGSPTWFLSRHVLGISQEGPTDWIVRPQLSGLARAAGSVPFDDGTLRVSLSAPNCSQLVMQLSAPEGTTGRVIFPPNSAITRIALNNTVIWANGTALADALVSETASGIAVALAGGTHSFSLQRACPAPTGLAPTGP